jgi:putative membrane protein
MKHFASVAAIFTLAACVSACNLNAPTAPSALNSTVGMPAQHNDYDPNLSDADKAIVAYLARINAFEAEMGDLAQRVGDRVEVTDYARQMDQDFTNAQTRLLTIAGDRQFPSNIAYSDAQQAVRTTLSALTGSDFDPAYMAQMVTDQEAVLAYLQARVSSVASASLSSHVADYIAMLQSHLARARDVLTIAG